MKNECERLPRIVILISGAGSNMLALAHAIERQDIQATLVAVISHHADAPGLKKAKALGLHTQVVDERQTDRATFNQTLLQEVKQHQADLIVLAGFMRVLDRDFVHEFYGRLLNLHPSLLPLYPGLNTHLRALTAGDSTHGATVHFVNEQLDQGPIIVQTPVPILKEDDPSTLADRVRIQEHTVYPIVVKWFCEGRLKLIDNQVRLDGVALPKQGVTLPL
jgi:phosphoribosylglycinamide formyltransferase-1